MFYLKLASTNLKKNHRGYLPFLISMLFLVAINTMTQVIVNNEGMRALPGGDSASSMFGLGHIVIMIFTVIFSFYTNSFLLKQRKKELGLYNILGLGKRELYQLMIWESFLSFFIVLITGLITGVVLSKLAFLVLRRLISVGNEFVFQLLPESLGFVSLLFLGIFFLLLLINCWQIKKTNPISLLHGSKKGEQEPKARWIIAILGLVFLGSGYGIAVTIDSPISALTLFFVAIILVILGTYCLFMAGSIALLKLLKRNERFYYKTNHFISISSMMHRMKQNAAGLASICILSTMVLVTAATTGSLFFGQKDVENTRYPRDVMISTVQQPEKVKAAIEAVSAEKQAPITKQVYLTSTKSIMFQPKNGNYQLTPLEDFYNSKSATIALISFMTAQEYAKHTDETVNLKDDEIYFYPVSGDIDGNQLKLENQKFKIKKRINKFPGINQQIELTDYFVVVLANQSVLEQCLSDWFPKKAVAAENYPEYNFMFNTDLKGEKNQLDFAQTLRNQLNQQLGDSQVRIVDKYTFVSENKIFTGGFFFLGIIFGATFILATALIIYYKQISEGIDDRECFEILQKVGMSHREVKKVIRSQVMMVFSFPLVVAVIHLGFAFPLIKKLLVLFGLVNWKLFLLVCVIVTVIFAILYFVVYRLTARSYYQLVERKS
ncbi:ABC transporter permease [Enterococcus avium]|uniref:ABC transporter permease n=1 Tax=Enterococcus avium TaxID=33945 RepID=UPI00232CA381|nr:FtsX-like permease family protein [Enterococcus avium]MDB1712262.1 FtsX-like permease family protein [Enterococcus avium]MDB1718732.1 FtsX-like permease family protein [Enterococcus avium]